MEKYKYLIFAGVVTAILSIFPEIMPDEIKPYLTSVFGDKYNLVWTVLFVTLTGILIYLAILDRKNSKNPSNTKISGIISKTGTTTINSKTEGDISIETVKSGKNTEITTENKEAVDIKDIESGEDTKITT